MNRIFPISEFLSVALTVFLSVMLSAATFAQDKAVNSAAESSKVITIETTTLRGNQELPTVLYLVPWQLPKINPLPASQTAEVSYQALEKIERNSFQRLMNYHQMFKSSQD